MTSHFQRQRFGPSSTYACRCCGKLTRETGLDESSVELCAYCYEEASWENSLADNICTRAEFDAEIASLRKKYGRDLLTGKPLQAAPDSGRFPNSSTPAVQPSSTSKASNTMTTKTAKKSSPKSTKFVNPTGKCLCGCGGKTERMFLPGHDAKLHSKVLAAFKAEKKVSVGRTTAIYLEGTAWMTKELRKAISVR